MKNYIVLIMFLAISSATYGQFTSATGGTHYSSGNVGIGTSAPNYLLHVKDATPSIVLERNGSVKWEWRIDNVGKYVLENATDSKEPFRIERNAPTSSFFIKGDGFVGIGTNNPEERLQIEESTNGKDVALRLRALTDGGSGRSWYITGDPDVRSLHLGEEASSSDLTIDVDGNIGLGTSVPTARLHVYDSDPTFLLQRLGSTTWETRVDNAGRYVVENRVTADEPFRIEASAPHSSMFIKGDGNVGLGTNAPDAQLHLVHATPSLVLQRVGSASWETRIDNAGRFALKNRGNAYEPLKIEPSAPTSSIFVRGDGNVGIGVGDPSSRLVVDGNVVTEEVKVQDVTNPPDYVFEADYELRSLPETKAFVQEHKHLPEIPSGQEMIANGIDLGEMNLKLLQKIEELTLHLIEQNERIEHLENALENLREE